MDAQGIIRLIRDAEKKTPVRMYVREKEPVDYGSARVFVAPIRWLEQVFVVVNC